MTESERHVVLDRMRVFCGKNDVGLVFFLGNANFCVYEKYFVVWRLVCFCVRMYTVMTSFLQSVAMAAQKTTCESKIGLRKIRGWWSAGMYTRPMHGTTDDRI